MKYILCLLALLCQGWLYAQAIRPLSLGDTLSPPVRHSLQQFTQVSHSLGKGKLLIIDFFATSCGACINALPRLDSLQKKFKDSLSILVTTYEPRAVIDRFLTTNPKGKHIRLPFLTGDSVLHQSFPHYLIPHEVWIREGKVIAITEAQAVNVAHIKKALSGEPLHVSLKKDILDFNPSLSLRSQLAESDTSLFLRQSLFIRQVEGLGTRRGVQYSSGTKRVYFINWNLLSLFQYAWKFPANRVLLEVPDPSLYLDRSSDPDQWKNNNLFCYESVYPVKVPDSLIREELAQVLNTGSPLTGSWQSRKLDCYVLTTIDGGPERSQKTRQAFRKDEITDSLYLDAHSMEAFTAICNEASQPSPGKPILLDETGIHYSIDLVLPAAALSDIELLQKTLEHCRLRLSPATRDLKVFVLSPNPSFHQIQKK